MWWNVFRLACSINLPPFLPLSRADLGKLHWSITNLCTNTTLFHVKCRALVGGSKDTAQSKGRNHKVRTFRLTECFCCAALANRNSLPLSGVIGLTGCLDFITPRVDLAPREQLTLAFDLSLLCLAYVKLTICAASVEMCIGTEFTNRGESGVQR